jgi:2-isopropylmalate synthase
VPPESVGNRARSWSADQGGKSNLLAELKRRGIKVAKDDPRSTRCSDRQGARGDAAMPTRAPMRASNCWPAARWHVPEFFASRASACMVERRYNAKGELKTVSEAVVKVRSMASADVGRRGHGPVNALDLALRKDLGKYQAEIADLELVDYKVRILNGGTEAVTRVLIESRDATGARWWTVGVSDNIIDASFQALMDSINLQADEEPQSTPFKPPA